MNTVEMNLALTYNRLGSRCHLRRILREWAVTIIIIGGQLGIYLNLLVINWDWNNKLMPLAALLLPNWRNLLSFRFPGMSRPMLALLLFFIIVLLYFLCNPVSTYVLRLFLYTMAILLCYSSLSPGDINISGIIKKVWIVSLICAIVGYYLDQSGMFMRMVEGSNESMAEIATNSKLVVGGGCMIGIVSALCYKLKSERMRWIVDASIFLEFIVVVFVGKRTPLLAAIVCLLFYVMNRVEFSKIHLWGRALVVCAVVLLGYAMLDSTLELSDKLQALREYTTSGIYDALNGTTASGNTSARYRFLYIHNGLDYINNFHWYNFIFGGGAYAAKMTDVPLLQSFVDMGIIGFLFYAGYVVIMPLKVIFSRKRKSDYIMFAALLCVYSVISCMNSGYPYDLTKWLPTIFLLFVIHYVDNCRRKLKKEV